MAKGTIKAKAKVSTKTKNKPVKAGRTMPKNVGGILNVKVLATSKKLRNG